MSTTKNRALRTVADPMHKTETVRTDSEDKLWAALHAHPNSSATDLANEAKIGKSTAGKILAKWEKDGTVTRIPGIAEGGRRAPDLWSNAANAHHTGPADTTHPDDVSADHTDPTRNVELAAAAEGITEGVAASLSTPDDEDVAKPDTKSESESGKTADNGRNIGGNPKATRLAPGALRGLVEDFLRDHPDQEFGPAAIAKTLGGKSSGAVSNALDSLAAAGTAVLSNEKPKRFTLAPTDLTTATASTK